MPEAARHHPSQDATRTATGPLRDWLTAMKAATAQPADERVEHDGQRQDRAQAQPSVSSWSPRVVTPPATSPGAAEADTDIADLMAENMVLKAKLRVEADRYNELQAILAQELRDLRAHIDEEMQELDEIRAERDLWMARAEALAQPLFQKR